LPEIVAVTLVLQFALNDDTWVATIEVDPDDLHSFPVQITDLIVKPFLFGEYAKLLGDPFFIVIGQIIEYSLPLDMFGKKHQVADHPADIADDHAPGQVHVERFARLEGASLGGVDGVIVHRGDNAQQQPKRDEYPEKTL